MANVQSILRLLKLKIKEGLIADNLP